MCFLISFSLFISYLYQFLNPADFSFKRTNQTIKPIKKPLFFDSPKPRRCWSKPSPCERSDVGHNVRDFRGKPLGCNGTKHQVQDDIRSFGPGEKPGKCLGFSSSFNFCLGFGEGKNPIAIVKNTSKEAENKFRWVFFLSKHHPGNSLWPSWDGENVTLWNGCWWPLKDRGFLKVTAGWNHLDGKIFQGGWMPWGCPKWRWSLLFFHEAVNR